MIKKLKLLYDLQLSAVQDKKFLFTVDSNVNVATFTMNYILKHRPAWSFLVVVPYPHLFKKPLKSSWVIRDEFTRPLNKQIKTFPYSYTPHPFKERFSFIMPELEKLEKEKIDVLMLNDPCKVLNWKTLFHSFSQNPVIVSRNHWLTGITHRKVPEEVDFNIRQVEGALFSDYMTFNSKYAVKQFLDNAKEHFNQSTYKKLKNKLKAIESVDVEKVQSLKPKEKDKKKYTTIIWPHRISYYTGWRETFDALNELWKKRKDFRLIVTDQGNKLEQTVLAKEYPFILQIDKKRWSHKKYIETLHRSDIVLGNHKYPATWGGLAITEAMTAGCVPLLPKKWCYPEMMYSVFSNIFFDNEKDMIQKLEHFLNDPDSLKRTSPAVQHFIKHKLSPDRYALFLIKLIEKAYDNHNRRSR